MRLVKLSDEVAALIDNAAVEGESINQTLVRLLAGQPAGALIPLLDAGKLRPGDELVFDQPRRGATYRANVTADGYVQTMDGRRFQKPSAALKELVRHEINGWLWTVARTGRSLKDLRAELSGGQ